MRVATLPRVVDAKIVPIAWSDHDLVLLQVRLGMELHTEFQWVLNESLLSDPAHVARLQLFIEDYFKQNDTSDVSSVSLWEAY